MDTLKSLELAPFNLDARGIAWVRATLAGLSTEDRLRQLFVHVSFGDDPAAAAALAARWRASGSSAPAR